MYIKWMALAYLVAKGDVVIKTISNDGNDLNVAIINNRRFGLRGGQLTSEANDIMLYYYNIKYKTIDRDILDKLYRRSNNHYVSNVSKPAKLNVCGVLMRKLPLEATYKIDRMRHEMQYSACLGQILLTGGYRLIPGELKVTGRILRVAYKNQFKHLP